MKSTFLLLLSVLAILAATGALHAQSNYYFDPLLSGSGTGSGGSGSWDTGLTPVWYNGSADTSFPAAAAANADFEGAGGLVLVNGSVDPANINFGGSSAYTVDAGASGSIDLGTANNISISNTNTSATLNAPITFSGGTGTIVINLNNSGTGSLVFGSTVTNAPTATPQFFEVNANTGTSEFTGNILGANTGYDPNSGSPTNDNINVSGGATMLVDNGNFNRFQAIGGSLLTKGAVTVTAANSFTANSGTVGGSTADLSNFTGSMANFGGTQTLTAVAAGRVDFSGDIFGGGVGSGNNMVINGDGIIAFTKADGMDYASQYNGGSNTAAGTEIKKGTLLIENTQSNTSATGAGWNQNSNSTSASGANNVVQIDSNATGIAATLGGYGYTLEQVVAVGAKSALTPGDISKDGLVTPGTLHLYNGLEAVNGLTVNFTLTATPSTSATIQIATTSINPQNGNVTNGAPAIALNLAGDLTFNLSGPVDATQTYTLFSSAAGTAWTIPTTSAGYTVTGAPTGYAANVFYVANDNGREELNVNFASVPEPSTYAMLGLGALLLVWRARRKLA